MGRWRPTRAAGARRRAPERPPSGADRDLAQHGAHGRLAGLSQIDLAKVAAHERKKQNRTTITERISGLQGDEPWAGYDELTVSEIVAVLGEGDETRIKKARSYERAHKNRAGVLEAAERETTNA